MYYISSLGSLSTSNVDVVPSLMAVPSSLRVASAFVTEFTTWKKGLPSALMFTSIVQSPTVILPFFCITGTRGFWSLACVSTIVAKW